MNALPMPTFFKSSCSRSRNRYRLFRFGRRESDDFVGLVNGIPPHVGYVAKPCASIITEKNRAALIAVCCLHDPGDKACVPRFYSVILVPWGNFELYRFR
jgi:hypothetical protein